MTPHRCLIHTTGVSAMRRTSSAQRRRQRCRCPSPQRTASASAVRNATPELFLLHSVNSCGSVGSWPQILHMLQASCRAGRQGSACHLRSGIILRCFSDSVVCHNPAVQTVTKRGVGGSSFVSGYRRILTPEDSLEAHAMLGARCQTAEYSQCRNLPCMIGVCLA